MDLREEIPDLNVKTHWYYQEKFFHLHNSIKKYHENFTTITDIGAGSAPFLKQLADLYPNKKFNAVDPNYVLQKINDHKSIVKYSRNLKKADIYIITDVLEHLENPVDLLEQVKKISKSGDLLIITVPAFDVLWSGHDIFLKHFKRYNKKILIRELSHIDCEIIELKYIYNLLFLPVLFQRLIAKNKISSQLKVHNNFLNKCLSVINKCDHLTMNKLPFGVSLFATVKL